MAERVNRAIRSLNSLYFGKGSFEDNTATSLADMPLNQRLTVEGIIDAVKYLGPPPDACDPGSQKLGLVGVAKHKPHNSFLLHSTDTCALCQRRTDFRIRLFSRNSSKWCGMFDGTRCCRWM